MKTLRYVGGALAAIAMTLSFTACSDDDNDDNAKAETLYVSQYAVDYNADNYWSGCYTVGDQGFDLGDFHFTHEATESEWDGYVYKSWYGFCPSRVNDTNAYPEAWLDNMWASITGGGVQGPGTPYIVAFWNSSEADGSYSLAITRKDGKQYRPLAVSVTNNTYAYYVMRDGSNFSQKFDADSWFSLTVRGISQGGVVGSKTVFLAKGTDLSKVWQTLDLSGMGYVDGLVFTLASSDTGQWGMNTPAYFCLDALRYEL